VNELWPIWRKYFDLNWKFGLFLIFIICVPRFILVLAANKTANYSYMALIMAISAVIPFIFLNKYGKETIGLIKPQKYSWLFFAFIFGLFFSILLYLLGESFYKNSFENWYVYIGKSYKIPSEIRPGDKLMMFVIMAATGMIFSPIGEELFFRGIVHSSFAKSVGYSKALGIVSSAFALIHISHFGLVFINNRWGFLPVPAIIWSIGMFLVSVLFYICRIKSGSLLGSIICHSGFNLGMIYCIFYFLN
jgi:membrane protease YdiL (CAAX protease family)